MAWTKAKLAAAICCVVLIPIGTKIAAFGQFPPTQTARNSPTASPATTQASPATRPSPFAEMDAKIAGKLDARPWSAASAAFVRQWWAEYKQAHLDNDPDQSTASDLGLGRGLGIGDITEYRQFIGSYARADRMQRPFFDISVDQAGRYFVTLQRRTIPAVTWNRCIVFTTGDVVFSRMPSLARQTHATIEVFVITRIDSEFYFGEPGAMDSAMKLVRLGDPTTTPTSRP